MNVGFRVDASSEIGSGHVIRSLVLAETLSARGFNVVFLSRLLDGHLIRLIMARGFKVFILGVGSEIASNKDWLGVSQEDDAKDTIEHIQGKLIDIIFVDHYSLDSAWETLVRPYVGSIVVIDDLANRNHNCDFLIDQNFRNDGTNDYDAMVPLACKILMGPRYAILSPEYKDFRKIMPSRDGIIKRVMVYFGGTDWQNMTSLAIKVLSQDEFRFLDVDVVVGNNFPFLSQLEEMVSQRPKTKLHQALPNLAGLMCFSDLAIGAGGTTTWERMCLGLPSLVISLADNQLPACKALDKENLIHYLGNYNEISDDILTISLRKRLRNSKENAELTSRIARYVDGLGVQRIVQAICPMSIELITLRVCNVSDSDQIYFIDSDSLSLGTIEGYSFDSVSCVRDAIQNGLEANDCSLFSVEHNGLVLGLIKNRYCAASGSLVISYILHVDMKDLRAKLVVESAEMSLQLMPIFNPVDRFSCDEDVHFMLRLSNSCVTAKNHNEIQFKNLVFMSAKESWVNDHILDFCLELLLVGYGVRWIHDLNKPMYGDVCFYLGFDKIVPLTFRQNFLFNLVVHESALPQGRGWSPLSWQILEGKNEVCITLLDAANEVDSGVIYLQDKMCFDGYELIEDLRATQAQKTFELCRKFLCHSDDIVENAQEQYGEPSLYPRRLPEDSELNVNMSVSDLFNNLRVADPVRYPSFFKIGNVKYTVTIQKADQ